MARCSGCNKMASYDESFEPEESTEFSLIDGLVVGSVHISVSSECCSEELKSADFDIEVEVGTDWHACDDQEEVGIEVDLEALVEMKGKVRSFGVTGNGSATCDRCKESKSFSFQEKIAASAMDDA